MSKKGLLTIGRIVMSFADAFMAVGISREEQKEFYDKGYNQGFQDYPRMLAENAKQTGDAIIQLNNGDKLVVRYEQ